MSKFIVNRDIASGELDWLPEGIQKNTVVYKCVLCTFGCCSPFGIACTLDPDGGYPFFELPVDALTAAPT